ncbi:MAG: YihY/virulence factor BrkB family protein [Acidimicrobiia bacterium]
MSTATPVPETWELTGDDARQLLLHTGRRTLIRDAFQRLRSADGFSHARSLAFVLALVLVQAIIALVGLAAALGKTGASDLIVRSIEAAAPGPAGQLLTSAVQQAHAAGASGRYTALWLGLAGAIVTGTTMFGQFERALNRLYGVEKDRPTVQKYGRAFVLVLTVGVLSVLAFTALALGRAVGEGLEDDAIADVWAILRWPAALLLMMAAMALLFRWSPRRHQPSWSWLAFGASISVLLWTLVTLGLGLFFRLSTSFGDTYGPLAGIVALLLWSLLSSVAVLFGAAVAAQLEAVRAGVPAPQDAEKIEHSEPASEQVQSRPIAAAR